MESMDLFAASIKMISSLALVLGVVIFAMFLLRKAVNRGSGLSGRPEVIRILSVRYLGGKNSIALIDVAGTVIVVGMTPSGMLTLATIGDIGALEELGVPTERIDEGRSFARHLARYVSRFRSVGTVRENEQ